uniref:Uncharacterized protein n=1 Tax=Glycine max TaxID=3847 RepID=I1M8E1_SOYBN
MKMAHPKVQVRDSTSCGCWVLSFFLLFGPCSLLLSLSNGQLGTSTVTSILPLSTISMSWYEVEEREKVVRRMWDVYTQSKSGRGSGLPRFWSDAFHAAYDHLVSDVQSVRDAAVSEIAKISLHSLPLHHLKSHSIVQNIMGSRKMKQAESIVNTTISSDQ